MKLPSILSLMKVIMFFISWMGDTFCHLFFLHLSMIQIFRLSSITWTCYSYHKSYLVTVGPSRIYANIHGKYYWSIISEYHCQDLVLELYYSHKMSWEVFLKFSEFYMRLMLFLPAMSDRISSQTIWAWIIFTRGFWQVI
jgi:hypothetical protein